MISRWRRARQSGLIYLLAGALMALAFPLGPSGPGVLSTGLWICGWLCLAPLMIAAAGDGRMSGAALGGLTAGLAGFVPILCWMHPFLMRWGFLSWPEAGGVFLLLVSYIAAYSALFAIFVRIVSARWGPVIAITLSPAAWVALELGRGTLLTGFPWCLLGYSQARLPLVVQIADAGGVYAVSFLLACGSAALSLLWIAWRSRGARPSMARLAARWAIAPALVAVAGLTYGAWRVSGNEPEGSLPVALVQANVAQSDKWDPAERDRIEADHVRMTREAVAQGARLVVWSESSVPASITTDLGYAARLQALARETGADLIVGTVAYEGRGGRRVPLNSAVLIGPDGPMGERYDKQHLVPFGEYVPLRGMLFFLESLTQEAGDFEPGTGGPPLPSRGAALGPLICYEAVFPELTRAWVRRGASALVNLTNDAWYGDTGMPRQHLAMAILRAVESRRWLMRCANTGISALIDPRGRVRQSARLDQTALVLGSIRPAAGLTVYAAIGDSFAIACAILAASSLALALWRRPARTGAQTIESARRETGRPTRHHAS